MSRGNHGEVEHGKGGRTAAERWQYEQAHATWDRFRRGEGRTVPREEIQDIFARALGPSAHAEQKCHGLQHRTREPEA